MDILAWFASLDPMTRKFIGLTIVLLIYTAIIAYLILDED